MSLAYETKQESHIGDNEFKFSEDKISTGYLTRSKPIVQTPVQQDTLKQLRRHFDAINHPIKKGVDMEGIIIGAVISVIVDAIIQGLFLKSGSTVIAIYFIVAFILGVVGWIFSHVSSNTRSIEKANYCLDEIEADIQRLYSEVRLDQDTSD